MRTNTHQQYREFVFGGFTEFMNRDPLVAQRVAAIYKDSTRVHRDLERMFDVVKKISAQQ